MKFSRMIVVAAIALFSSASAFATTVNLTATSGSWGTLGFLQYDSSSFNGSSFQFVNNTFLTGIDFTDPQSGFHVTTAGPSDNGTYIDSSGEVPTVVGGGGFTGGTDFGNGVWIAGSTFVALAGNYYYDVSWSATEGSEVPEPASYALLALGLAAVIASTRRRQMNAVK